jgi:hypothetical protein
VLRAVFDESHFSIGVVAPSHSRRQIMALRIGTPQADTLVGTEAPDAILGLAGDCTARGR